MIQKIIILAYHGNSNWDFDGEEKNRLYGKISEKFKGFEIYETFNSESVIKKMTLEGKKVRSTLSLLKELDTHEEREIYIQPMYITEGALWRETKTKIEEELKDFKRSYISIPLFGDISTVQDVADIFIKKFDNPEKCYLFLGHGGKDIGNSVFGMLGYLMNLERENFFVVTLEGEIPLEKNVRKIIGKFKEIEVVPLFIQKGVHFEKDIEKNILPLFGKHDIIVDIREETLIDYDEIIEIISKKIDAITHRDS